MTVLKPTPYIVESPQPLVREIPNAAPYPVASLGPLRAVVEAVQAATQAPTAIAAQSALSVASFAIQPHADVETLGGYVPTSLYCLTIAQSGERKSACDKLVMSGLRYIERERATDYREQMDAWETDKKRWTAKHERMLKEAAGSNSHKARIAEVDLAALGPAPMQPLSPKLTTSEPTYEGLVKLFLSGQPSLGLFSDEGGGFLGGHAMNSDNRLKTVAGLSDLWGGAPIDRVRAGDGAFTLYGRRLAVHLMVQPVAARPLLSDPVAIGQGFLARFLIAEPPSAIGTRILDTTTDVADGVIAAATNRLGEILSDPLPLRERGQNELEPRQLPLSSQAKELLLSYYKSVELAQAPGGQLEQVRSFASKSPEQATRIAAVMTLWGDLQSPEITVQSMADGIELAQFYLTEAKRLAESATVSIEVVKAEKLRRWILESWPVVAASNGRDPDTIVPRDVVLMGPNSLRETAAVKKLLSILEQHGWLVTLEKGAVIDGQARQLAYQIVRGK